MPRQLVRVEHADGDGLRTHIAAIGAELEVPGAFPPDVSEAAERAAARRPARIRDRTDIPLVTIDPETSLDLDQAVHIERRDRGYRVHYAIADVAAFVRPGDPVDAEAHRRGETLYGAGENIPLHPRVLSEGAASLLPGATRPALLWTFVLNGDGEVTDARVERAAVRSTEKLSYEAAQARIDSAADGPDGILTLLKEVGGLRQAREADRGGIALPTPEQEIVVDGPRWSLRIRRTLPVEEWNAQISLLTGMAAADIMLRGGTGLLRTLPPPDPGEVTRLRLTARALGVPWPEALPHPAFIRGLDTSRPAEAAMAAACTRLLRGAGYVAFSGAPPAEVLHAGIAAPYAHVTAPLRRLADRYALEVCVALCAGDPVPGWVRAALDGLPQIMRRSGGLAGRYQRTIINLVEAAMLEPHVGAAFDGVVVQADEDEPTSGDVVIHDPAVEARLTSTVPLPVGRHARVALAQADRAARRVRFTLVPDGG